MGTIVSDDVTLPVDVFTSSGSNPHALDLFLTLRPMADLVIPTHNIAGIHVVDPVGAALGKVGGVIPRVKDVGSILKASLVGKHLGHPITNDPGWQHGVAIAKRIATTGEVDKPLWRKLMRVRPKYPSWLNKLVDTDFDHPASEI